MESILLWAGCPSGHPTISVKALKGTQSTNPNQWSDLILSSSTTGLLWKGRCSLYADSPTFKYSTHTYSMVTVSRQHLQLTASHRLTLPTHHTTPHHYRFTALFPGPPRSAGARMELLDFMVQGEINRGRHTDHLAGHHSIRTNQCPPPPFPHIFTGWMPFLPPNQQCQSTEGITNILAQYWVIKPVTGPMLRSSLLKHLHDPCHSTDIHGSNIPLLFSQYYCIQHIRHFSDSALHKLLFYSILY